MVTDKQIKVNQQDYTESKLKCQKCDEQLLLFVHKDCKKKRVILGCGRCGHKNEIEVITDETNMHVVRS